jgi:hypothetical protein
MDSSETPVAQPPFPIGLLVALVVGLTAAGLGAGFTFDATRGKFDAKLPDTPAPSEKQIREGIALQEAGFRKSSSFAGACAGALIVGLLGTVLGGASRAVVRLAGGLVLGALLGAGSGAAGGYASQEVSEYTISHGVSSMTAYLLISLAFWTPLGIGAAIVSSLVGPRRVSPTGRISGPILGALLAAVLVPMVASIAFPLDYKGRIPPRERNESLLVGALGGALLGLGAGMTLRPKSIPSSGPTNHA